MHKKYRPVSNTTFPVFNKCRFYNKVQLLALINNWAFLLHISQKICINKYVAKTNQNNKQV